MTKKHEEKIVEEINLGGFKYLAEKNKTIRIIWASVIVLFLALTVYQISEQITKYISNPVSTNVEVQYPQRIHFPAIAICNNNQFRQSYLLGEEFQSLTKTSGTPDSDPLYFEQVIRAIPDRPAMEFLRNSAHDLSNLLASCILPNGTACGYETWTQLWTVNGQCWALNLDMDNPFEVTDSGPGRGLKLVLNAESYERTDTCGRVLNSQAETGFKILIFNQTERPITTAEGVSVSPGMSVNIPFRIKHRKKLSGPNCRSETKESKAAAKSFTSPNNIRACPGRILHEKFDEKCDCSIRGLFTGEKEVHNECDVQMYFSCVLPYLRSLHSNLSAEIGQQCLPACETIEYIPTQDVNGLPKKLFPYFREEEEWLYKAELKAQSSEQRFIGHDENGSRMFEEVTLNCAESTYIPGDYAKRTLKHSRFVLEERSRVDFIDRKTFSDLITNYQTQQDYMAGMGWPMQLKYKKDYSFTIADMILQRTKDCSAVLWLFKNETKAFARVRAFDLLVQTPPASLVKWKLLDKFALDEYLGEWTEGRMTKYRLAELVQDGSYLPFFHEEFQRYWAHPIQDALYEAQQAFLEDRDRMEKILKNGHFDIDPKLVDWAMQRLPGLILQEFEDFREQAKRLGVAFDAAFKDHLGDYYEKSQIDDDFEKANMALVNIYLQSNTIESWTQNADYTFWTLACDIGGALGLFIGASVMSILEIAYVLYQHRMKRKQHKEQHKEHKRVPHEHEPLHDVTINSSHKSGTQ